ncbi:MAG TPA: YhjD/YihY/BrkB family envelope integrity protein [Gaiellaceae bacterium]
MSAVEERRAGERATRVLGWVKGRADTSLGRLAFLWFRRYFEASRNSGAAVSAYFTLSVVPCALAGVAYFHLAGGNENALAGRMIDHLRLDETTADIVRQTFGSTSDNVVAATLVVVVGFLLWGLGIGQLYRDVYARAWRIKAGSASDQALFTIWFFVVAALVALLAVSTAQLQTKGYVIVIPAWLVASTVFWLWTPRFLLHRAIPIRSLFPGALLASFVMAGTIGTSPLWIGPTLTQNANAFGSFGVVIAMLAYVLIFVTISLICAVFSPVWFEWREGERELRRSET